MADFNCNQERALGNGKYLAGAVDDTALKPILSGWKRHIAGSYRAVLPDEMTSLLPHSAMWVTPKIDGELWFLVLGEGAPYLANPRGDVIIGEVPVLSQVSGPKPKGRSIIAGELHVISNGRRARVGDLASAMAGGGKAEVDRISFTAFDLVESASIPALYDERLDQIHSLIGDGHNLSTVPLKVANTPAEVAEIFVSLVEQDGQEGLVVRDAAGMIYKIKPSVTIDCIALGYTTKAIEPGMARSILLGLMHEDGSMQLVGACGNLGSAEDRTSLLARLKPLYVDSGYRHASDSGGLYTFVKPEVVVEVRVTDIQAEKSDGSRVESMALNFDKRWSPIGRKPSASLLHPVVLRVREDKTANPTDARFSQLAERIPPVGASQTTIELPKSQLIRREAWTKDNKGKLAVRKLIVWKTNKEQADDRFPAYVVHWTDYSPGRATPLDREVRLAMDEPTAMTIADKMVEENIKKGWEKI